MSANGAAWLRARGGGEAGIGAATEGCMPDDEGAPWPGTTRPLDCRQGLPPRRTPSPPMDNVTRRDAIALSGSTLAGLSLGMLTADQLAAQAAPQTAPQ